MRFRPDHPANFVNPQPRRFQFIGRGGEYFRIWFVNLFLSIITLGIYSAWAKVRRERYFTSHTLLDDSPFEYHGNPVAILKGRALAVLILGGINVLAQIAPLYALLTVPMFLIGLPWAVRSSIRFKATNTSWRGVRFSFTGGVGQTAMVMYGWGLLNIITLGATIPASIRRWHTFIFNNLRFGGQHFHSEPGLGGYYQPFVIPALLGIAVTVVTVLFAMNQTDALTAMNETVPVIIGSILFLVYGLFPLLFFAYVNVRIRNHVLANTLLGMHGLASDMTIGGMCWVILKHGALTLVTLGLSLPILQVALARYRTEHLLFYPVGGLDNFVAAQLENQRAFGEELTDIMNMDLGM